MLLGELIEPSSASGCSEVMTRPVQVRGEWPRSTEKAIARRVQGDLSILCVIDVG